MMELFEAELKKAYAQAANKPAKLEQFREQVFGQFNAGSNQLLDVIFAKLKGPRGVHLETALGAAAGLTGALLLRGSGVDVSKLQPGAPVFIDAVNETGPDVLSFMQALSHQMGIQPMGGWDQPVPDDHKPLQPLVELVRELEKPFMEISQKMGIYATLRPYMAAMGAVKIMQMGAGNLSPEISKAILMSSLVAGSKTVPYPLQ